MMIGVMRFVRHRRDGDGLGVGEGDVPSGLCQPPIPPLISAIRRRKQVSSDAAERAEYECDAPTSNTRDHLRVSAGVGVALARDWHECEAACLANQLTDVGG